MMWSKVKQILRSLEPRTHEELMAAIATALCSVTAADARNGCPPVATLLFNFIFRKLFNAANRPTAQFTNRLARGHRN
jgi:hypothetical protein